VALGLTAWLGWLTSEGTLRVELGPWRGVLDAAWIGGSLAVMAATFLSLFGGWLVRGTIARDRSTGVGEILATTPLSRPAYLLGKWLSHFVYLSSLAVMLALLALPMLARNAEAPGFDIARLWLPMLLVALPALAFVAGLVVATEVLPLLRGSFGNVAWMFLWALPFILSLQTGLFDFSGLAATRASLRADIRTQHGVDEPMMRVGGGPRRATRTFVWHGFDWTPGLVASRLAWIGLGGLLALVAVPAFDRFDPSRRSRLRRRVTPASGIEPESPAPGAPPVARTRELPSARSLPAARRGRSFAALVRSQLLYALRGRTWVFWAGGLALAAGSFAATPSEAPPLALAYVWPILVWSRLGASDPAVAPVLAACPRPVARPLLAAFAGGALVAALLLTGPISRAVAAGQATTLAALAVAVSFPPALSLALGAWARTPRPFEALYTCLWYVGMQTPPNPAPFAAAVPLLLAAAAVGRARRT
jgi:hypothetical protein